MASDTEHWNCEPTSERPATKHPGHNTTRGLKQETCSQWLGEVTSARNVGMLGVTPSDIKEDGEQNTPTHMTARLSHPKAKKPRVCAQTMARTKTGQPPFSRRSHQECSKQTTRRGIICGKEACRETMDYKPRLARQTPNDIKDLRVTAEGMPQVSSDEQASRQSTIGTMHRAHLLTTNVEPMGACPCEHK